MGGRAALAAALGLLALAGCGGATDDAAKTSAMAELAEIAAPLDLAGVDWNDASTAAGTCLGPGTLGDSHEALAAEVEAFGLAAYTAMGDDPNWDDVVDCSKPHGYEVYDVVTLPADVDEQITAYADVLRTGGSLARAIRTATTHACASAFEPAAAVMEAAPLEVDVLPVVNVDAHLTLTVNPLPPADWAAGRRGFACLLAHDPPGAVRAAHLVTAGLPVADRICLSGHTFTACDEPHDAERIAVLAVNAAVDSGSLRGKQAVDLDGRVDLGNAQWAMLDEVCDRYLREISRTPAPGLAGVANTYPEAYPDADGGYRVVCSAQSPFGTRPADAVVTDTSVYDE